VYHAVLVLLQC